MCLRVDQLSIPGPTTLLAIKTSTFRGNIAQLGAALTLAVYPGCNIGFRIEETSFVSNHIAKGNVQQGTVRPVSTYGDIISLQFTQNVTMAKCVFENNTGCSIICHAAQITFSGETVFNNNTKSSGTLKLYSMSEINITDISLSKYTLGLYKQHIGRGRWWHNCLQYGQ